MAGAIADGTNLADVTIHVQEYQPAPWSQLGRD
jgi:predicted Zn-dependent protease